MSILSKIQLQDSEINEALQLAIARLSDPLGASIRLETDELFAVEAKQCVIEVVIMVALAKTMESDREFDEETYKLQAFNDPLISELKCVIIKLLGESNLSPAVPVNSYRSRIEKIIELSK